MSSPTPRIPSNAPDALRVLVVEDEPALADSMGYSLQREGFTVTSAPDGVAALARFQSDLPSIVILDLMLPKLSGLDVCREIRRTSTVPIIMLTAKDSEADKVAGLELGADDYVTKPFSMRELISRIRAQLRRAGMAQPSEVVGALLSGGPVSLDADRHEVRVRGEVRDFTPKEFELLEALLERKDRLLPREQLISKVWGADYVGDTKTLDVHIKRLRHKIEKDPARPRHLITVRGLGYKFVD